MPPLTAFGRKWRISSDDFVFPALSEAFIRGFWLLFIAAVYSFHYPFACGAIDVRIYLYVLIVSNTITILSDFILAFISSRGTIMNPRPRRAVAYVLYFRLPMFIVEVVWTFVATFKTFRGEFKSCSFYTAIRMTIALEWILIVSVLVGLFIVINPSDDGMEDAELMTRKLWSRRFRIFKIRQDQIMRAALDDIANMIASFFVSGDYVFSDIVAGLLLLVHSPANCYPPLLNDDEEIPSWMSISSARHFAHFATCVYGWPSYLIHNASCVSYWKLLRRIQCCGQLRCDQVLVVEDNCCVCNTAAFVLATEERNIDLFFVSFRNDLYKTPFVVLADHDSQSIVITIRGSCSLIDLVTDLCLDDEVLPVNIDSDPVLREDPGLGVHSHVRVHRGMLRSARYVFDLLKKHQVLEDLRVLHPTYQLVVCGHSLGAGVASLLTLLLKQQNLNIRCYAFAPPGCVISEEGQAEMRENVMSVVTRDDVVSRISYQSMHRLRLSVERELHACTKAKYEILIKGVFRLFFHAPWEISGVQGQLDTDFLVSAQNLSSSYGAAHSPSSATPQCEAMNIIEEGRVQLYAPGKVLYLAEEDKNSNIVVKWINPKCLSDIKLSASSVTDHLPKFVHHILQKAELSVTPELVIESSWQEN